MCSLYMNMITHHSNSGCHATSYSVQNRVRTEYRMRWVGRKLPIILYSPNLRYAASCMKMTGSIGQYNSQNLQVVVSIYQQQIFCLAIQSMDLSSKHPCTCMYHALVSLANLSSLMIIVQVHIGPAYKIIIKRMAYFKCWRIYKAGSFESLLTLTQDLKLT